MNGEFDGDVDVFDDGSSAVAGQAQLEKAREFVVQYDTQLRTLEYALTDALMAPWDPERERAKPLPFFFLSHFFFSLLVDPIALEVTPYEQTNLLELIATDNRVFNKIMKVFVWLSDESRLLETIVSRCRRLLSITHIHSLISSCRVRPKTSSTRRCSCSAKSCASATSRRARSSCRWRACCR